MVSIVTLVSMGRHPNSGVPRCSPIDRRAVEMSMSVDGADQRYIHAGLVGAPALQDYLGTGIGELHVINLPSSCDVVPPLAAALSSMRPDLIFAGERSDGGEESGMVPYLLGADLGVPVVPPVDAVVLEGRSLSCTQVLSAGRRRKLVVPLPAVVIVSEKAPMPRGLSYRGVLGGCLSALEVDPAHIRTYAAPQMNPAKPVPKAIRDAGHGTFADRLRRATTASRGGQDAIEGLSAEGAAERIFDYLRSAGCPGF